MLHSEGVNSQGNVQQPFLIKNLIIRLIFNSNKSNFYLFILILKMKKFTSVAFFDYH